MVSHTYSPTSHHPAPLLSQTSDLSGRSVSSTPPPGDHCGFSQTQGDARGEAGSCGTQQRLVTLVRTHPSSGNPTDNVGGEAKMTSVLESTWGRLPLLAPDCLLGPCCGSPATGHRTFWDRAQSWCSWRWQGKSREVPSYKRDDGVWLRPAGQREATPRPPENLARAREKHRTEGLTFLAK